VPSAQSGTASSRAPWSPTGAVPALRHMRAVTTTGRQMQPRVHADATVAVQNRTPRASWAFHACGQAAQAPRTFKGLVTCGSGVIPVLPSPVERPVQPCAERAPVLSTLRGGTGARGQDTRRARGWRSPRGGPGSAMSCGALHRQLAVVIRMCRCREPAGRPALPPCRFPRSATRRRSGPCVRSPGPAGRRARPHGRARSLFLQRGRSRRGTSATLPDVRPTRARRRAEPRGCRPGEVPRMTRLRRVDG